MVALGGVASGAAFLAESGEIRVYSVTNGTQFDRFRAPKHAKWIGFSPMGKWMLTSGDGIAFNAVSVASGRVVAEFSHSPGPVSFLLYTADGQYLTTASNGDGTACIWDLEASREVVQWHLQAQLKSFKVFFSVDDLAFRFEGLSYGGARLSMSGLWRPQDLIAAACATVNRDLTEDEWRQCFPTWELWRPTCSRGNGD